MRILSFLTTCLTVLLLTACGGGGGSPGVGSGAVQAFSVAAPAAVTLQVGLTQQYVVQGGVKPYTVFSNNPAVVVGWLIGENVVAIGTTAAGLATVTVVDAKGVKFDVAVTAGSTTALFTTAAASMTITPGPNTAQTYIIGGGVAPYTAISSFPSVATVVVNGNQMTITGVQISGTVANVTIRDAAGATLPVAVTVGTVPLAANPTNPTIATGSIFRSVITGGTPPYRTIVLDNCVTDAKIVQGNILEAKGNKPCTGSALTVVDANNQTVNFDVTINAGTSILQLAPSAFTIPESTNTPDLQLLLYGANSGAIQVFSTNTSILAPQAAVSNSDGTYTIKLTGGNTCSQTVTPGSAAIPATVGPPPTPFVPAVPATGGDRTITITAIDSTGRIGTGTYIVKDTNGVAGC